MGCRGSLNFFFLVDPITDQITIKLCVTIMNITLLDGSLQKTTLENPEPTNQICF